MLESTFDKAALLSFMLLILPLFFADAVVAFCCSTIVVVLVFKYLTGDVFGPLNRLIR